MEVRPPDRHERVVVLGRIKGAFGVAGWVKIESYTDRSTNLLNYRTWLIRDRSPDRWIAMRPLDSKVAGNALHVKLEGVTTREDVAKLRGAEIGVPRSELPPLPKGEYYWIDLVGLEAYSPEGELLGEIAEIRAAPAHPFLRVVERAGVTGKSVERWVPLVDERVRSVDTEQQRVVLDWQRDWS